jgi:hypothetical protein
MTDRISLLLSLTPSKLTEILPTMSIREIEELSHQMIRMLTYHNHCCHHRVRIPEEMRRLEKSWDQTLPIMKQLLQERNGTTSVRHVIGASQKTITPLRMKLNSSSPSKNGHSKGVVITAIIAKEVGENGNRHFQGYLHFKKLMRQSAIHVFLGYDSPCMHF